MDNIIDSLSQCLSGVYSNSCRYFGDESERGGQKTPVSDAALENFKQRWELLRVACDQAEEFVESVKQRIGSECLVERIGSECLVDEATGSAATKPGNPIPSGPLPISAILPEQMSKADRWLVM